MAYVDNDPVVVSHARALRCTAPGVCAFQGDLRDPPGILGHPDLRAVIDLGEPVAIVLAAVLHFIPDEDSRTSWWTCSRPPWRRAVTW